MTNPGNHDEENQLSKIYELLGHLAIQFNGLPKPGLLAEVRARINVRNS